MIFLSMIFPTIGIHWLGAIAVIAPLALLLMVGFHLLLGRPFSEPTLGRLLKATLAINVLAILGVLGWMLITGSRREIVDFGNMISIEREHFHFHISIIFDRLSIPMALMTCVLCGTVGSFALSYLHRDTAFNVFFLSYALFTTGMLLASLAGTIETLFLGWELVGLSSALLIAYFHERPLRLRMDFVFGLFTVFRTLPFWERRSFCIISMAKEIFRS